MIQLSDTAKMLYRTDSIKKKVTITFTDGSDNLGNANLIGNVKLHESISSGDTFKFGNCEAASLEFECFDIANIKGKRVTAKLSIADGDTWIDIDLGVFTIDTCPRQSNMLRRSVTAYDDLYSNNLDKDVSVLVNNLVAAHAVTPVTLYALKAAVLNYCGINWDTSATPSSYETAALDITGYAVQSSLTGRTVIQSILEISGKMGKMSRAGVFSEITLPGLADYLYPSDDLYPDEALYPACMVAEYDKLYIPDYKSAWYEEYQCKRYGKIQIVASGNLLSEYTGDATINNTYIIQDNWIYSTFNFSSTFLTTMLMAMWGNIEGRFYTPVQVECRGFPWLETGDLLEIKTSSGTVMSYLFDRTLTYGGGSSLSDSYKSDGKEMIVGFVPTNKEVNQQPDWNASNGKASIKNKPESMPASDVYEWAKAPTKPAYTASEVGADAAGSASNALTASKAYTDTVASNKVDKVSGKGLSSNDYTSAEKTKLSGIATGAEINVQSDWSATSGDAFIKNKPTSMPASDVYAWAKASSKPTYTPSEVGAVALAPDGTHKLIENNKVSITYIPDQLLGQLLYGGNVSGAVATLTGNAKAKLGTTSATITLTNNTAAITGYVANEGLYYIATADSTFAGLAILTGDWLLSTGSAWTKIDNTDAVTGIKGAAESTYRIGNVNLTKANIGLGNVNNTSDANKPISTSTQIALDSKASTTALTSHTGDTDNPHGVTKTQVGLGNVPNVTTNNQTPTYTVASSNANLASGEVLSTAMGKIAKAISSLITHLANTVSHITATERSTWNAKQNAITGAATTIDTENLTASRALVSNSSGKVAVSAVTATELGYLDGVTSNVQSQINAKSPLVLGTQTAATGTWTGVASTITALTDGQEILYWLPYNGSGNATLNLTLSGGGTTGAKNCYYSGANRLTTHYPGGNLLHLTYRVNANVNGTNYTGWWADANYFKDTYDRLRIYNNVKAQSAIVANNLIVGTRAGYKHLKLGTAFDVTYPILYAGSAIASGATGNNNYMVLPATITTTQSISFTSYKSVYIKGQLSGTTFTPISTAPVTQTIATSADGYEYLLLGIACTASVVYLFPEHPVCAYVNGAFQRVSAPLAHTHDDRYYNESEIDTKLSGLVKSGRVGVVVTVASGAIQWVTLPSEYDSYNLYDIWVSACAPATTTDTNLIVRYTEPHNRRVQVQSHGATSQSYTVTLSFLYS